MDSHKSAVAAKNDYGWCMPYKYVAQITRLLGIETPLDQVIVATMFFGMLRELEGSF